MSLPYATCRSSVVEVVLDDADRHAEEPVDLAHPLGVAPGEVVVDRDDVDAFAFERVEIGRQRGDEGLALAGLHLGNLALVQDGAADELDVEVPHVEHAASGLPHDRKRLRKQVVERRALGEAFAEFRGLGAQLLLGERLDGRLERVDLAHDGAQTLELAFVLGADDFGEECLDHLRRR